MKQALAQFQAPTATPIEAGQVDDRYHAPVPEGALVVRVQAKILGGYPPTTDRWRKIFQEALSRDNLWLTAAEQQALVAGGLPPSLQQRLVRFHLIDNTRGEPQMWKPQEITAVDLSLEQGLLSGTVHLETASGNRGYQANLLGHIEHKDGKITRFDLVTHGQFWGHCTYTPDPPAGKFPLAISFTLADGSDIADGVPPKGSRGWLRGYLQPQ